MNDNEKISLYRKTADGKAVSYFIWKEGFFVCTRCFINWKVSSETREESQTRDNTDNIIRLKIQRRMEFGFVFVHISYDTETCQEALKCLRRKHLALDS